VRRRQVEEALASTARFAAATNRRLKIHYEAYDSLRRRLDALEATIDRIKDLNVTLRDES
jgi:hypothetical protein